jgi:hypothetical protein
MEAAMTLRALTITLRGRLLDRVFGCETLRQRLRETQEECERLSVELAFWQWRARVAEDELLIKRRRRTD